MNDFLSCAARLAILFGTILVGATMPAHADPAVTPRVHAEWEIYAHPQRLIDVGERRLNLYCLGEGSPTVILDGGLGDDITAWRHVQSSLAKTTRVCSYDRAGYGFSDPGPMPRDAAELARDLDSLLRKAEVDGPYVLVGQSLAGLHIRLFADQHLRDVAGMVLIDPSFEHQVARYEAAIPSSKASSEKQLKSIRACINALQNGIPSRGSKAYKDCIGDPEPDMPQDVVNAQIAQASANYYRTALSELQEFSAASSNEVDASRRSYGNLPLIVLSASAPRNAGADTLTRFRIWYAMHDRIARLSKRGENRIVARSTHHIQDSRPDVVIAAIDEVVDEARRH